MHIELSLTPGRPHYRTYNSKSDTGPECRAMMIPTPLSLKPVPTTIVAGCRRRHPPPAKPQLPPLSTPLPAEDPHQQLCSDRPDLNQVKMTNAINFVTFCKDPSTQAMTITWDELDHAVQEPE